MDIARIRRFVLATQFALLAIAGPASAQAPCGAPDDPCRLEGGEYYVSLPEDPDGAAAVLYLHGYAGSGRGVISNRKFTRLFTDRGYVVIAPSGQLDPPFVAKPKLDWGVRDGFDWPRDEVGFLRAVLADAAARIPFDATRVLAMGYSRGGSMVWDLACIAPDAARAYAAISGAFWEPMAVSCAKPVDLHHTHGFADRTVPIEGRRLSFHGHPFHMGDVFEGLRLWTELGGCSQHAKQSTTEGPFWIKSWSDCAQGSVTLALGPGGHGRPNGWIEMALDWFEALPRTGEN